MLAGAVRRARNAVLAQLAERDRNGRGNTCALLLYIGIRRQCGQLVEPGECCLLASLERKGWVKQPHLDTRFDSRAAVGCRANPGLVPEELLHCPHRRLGDEQVDGGGREVVKPVAFEGVCHWNRPVMVRLPSASKVSITSRR